MVTNTWGCDGGESSKSGQLGQLSETLSEGEQKEKEILHLAKPPIAQ